MSEIGWRGKEHLQSIKDLSQDEIKFIVHCSEILHNYSGKGSKLDVLRGHILDMEFFEPSTRTFKSTCSAMITMGGDCLQDVTNNDSRKKGEPKLDTLIASSQSCDIIAIRDSDSNTMNEYAKLPKRHRLVPLINCGSGSEEHPTQILGDAVAISQGCGGLEDLLALIPGDLKYGRVPHSLIYALRKFPNNRIVGFYVKDLKLPEKYKWDGYEEYDISKLSNFVKDIPRNQKTVLYLTRVQWERIAKERYTGFDQLSSEEKEKLRQDIQLDEYSYQLTKETVDSTPQTTRVLHPLPRGPEISDELFLYSLDPKIAPVDQMRYCLDARMAILGLWCGKEQEILKLASR